MLLQLSEHQTKANNLISCKHCGERCNGKITDGLHPFCCEGCKQVFSILQETNSCSPEQMLYSASVPFFSRHGEDCAKNG